MTITRLLGQRYPHEPSQSPNVVAVLVVNASVDVTVTVTAT